MTSPHLLLPIAHDLLLNSLFRSLAGNHKHQNYIASAAIQHETLSEIHIDLLPRIHSTYSTESVI